VLPKLQTKPYQLLSGYDLLHKTAEAVGDVFCFIYTKLKLGAGTINL